MAGILGAEYAGWLIHDGLALCYKFLKAAHQSCMAHLIRLCRDMAAIAAPATARFPLAIKQLLEQGLALRDRYLRQEISLHGLWTATGRLEAKLDRWLARSYRDRANRRLAQHLRQQDQDVFELLTDLLRSPEPKLLDIVPKVAAATECCSPAGGRAVGAPPPGPPPLPAVCFPDCAEVPVGPAWLTETGSESFFSSA